MAEFLVQGESITAVADAIREKGGTTAPLSFPAGMAAAVRNIQSGADLSLDITGATVGQIAKIKAVDETGKPTKWEPVEMANGGDKWELINEITIPDGADEVKSLTIDTDFDGKPFKLRRFMMCCYMPKYTGESEIPPYGFAAINGLMVDTSKNAASMIYTGLAQPRKDRPMAFSWVEGDIMGAGNHMCFYGTSDSSPNTHGNLCINSGVGGLSAWTRFRFNTSPTQHLYDVFRPITSVGTKDILMFPGCKVWLYGTRMEDDK